MAQELVLVACDIICRLPCVRPTSPPAARPQNNPFYDHLQAFSVIRHKFDEIWSNEPNEMRTQLEAFAAPDLFKKDGKRDGSMRQRAREEESREKTSDKFIRVRASAVFREGRTTLLR